MPDDAADRLDTLEMAIRDGFEERFPGRESPGDALDMFCAVLDDPREVKFCRNCIRTGEALAQIHARHFTGVEYVDAMTTLELLDARLGELTRDVARLAALTIAKPEGPLFEGKKSEAG